MTIQESDQATLESLQDDYDRLERKLKDQEYELGKINSGMAKLEQDKGICQYHIDSMKTLRLEIKKKIEFYKPT